MAVRNLRPGYVFRPKALELVEHFLVPKALGRDVLPGFVAEGVDVFSASPDALLPFSSNHRKGHGEVWGYFFAPQPAGEGAVAAPGGCWLPYGPVKAYRGGDGEAVAFRQRFAYHMVRLTMREVCGGGRGAWAQTLWLMTEYRLNKGAAAFRNAQPGDHKVNMDCVVRKVFTKSEVAPPQPLPSPARSSDEESTCSNYASADEEAGYSGQEQARKRARFRPCF
ncbi:hypothetical protein BRADI_5g13300v3 [Brachypodium distachyon]|uniref:NAC domain-containing protein n=1 Tax=Brachypodium distachyon TaxID=15368 RepID=A0A0Q3P337_BRADI|nr:hypothetical protein BRADI_5g13300v3 [Brachypodium distachyon]